MMWQRDTSGECPDEDEGNATLTDGSTSYTIMELEENSSYTITVTATNSVGTKTSNTTTGITPEAGRSLVVKTCSFDIKMATFFSAPSAAPTSVSVSEVTSSSITVQWGAVDCIHRNRDITGYSVQYGVWENESTRTRSVSDATEITIAGLVSSTLYEIQVAAVNSAGVGVYSVVFEGTTEGTVSNICRFFTIIKNN